VEEVSFQVSETPRGGPALAAILAARRPPGPDTAGHGGYGLWLVRQLCDRVQIRTGPGGTLIEIRMSLLLAPTA